MQTICQQIEINWPVKALFNYVSDISNNAAWQKQVAETVWLGDERNISGARFREVMKDSGNDEHALCQITEFVPYQKRSVRTQNQSFSSTSIFEFEPREQGTVMKLTVQVHSDVVNGPAEPFEAMKFLHERARDLFRLKEILELED
ncbi:MAG TPA: SRPBCC family protein [Ohtaekwangia sp.]|uniref:SRPBCC family protein n=1 Tax=Ohtaekwangia sp. TaxID=2066019 RepID=UPI002F9363B4